MRNLWTIYRYEIKKLTSKKLLWVTSLLCVVGIVITVTAGLFGTYYVDGEPIESHYEGFRKDQAYRKAIPAEALMKTYFEKQWMLMVMFQLMYFVIH